MFFFFQFRQVNDNQLTGSMPEITSLTTW